MGDLVMIKKRVLIIYLFFTPILFFIGLRLLHIIIGSPESIKYEIIEALICGYGASLGFWMLYRKVNKQKNKWRRLYAENRGKR
jgi:hypothetical protein